MFGEKARQIRFLENEVEHLRNRLGAAMEDRSEARQELVALRRSKAKEKHEQEMREARARVDELNARLPVGKERQYIGRRARVVEPAFVGSERRYDEDRDRICSYPAAKGVTVRSLLNDGTHEDLRLSIEDSEAWAPVKRNS